jgi:hypothetical protein
MLDRFASTHNLKIRGDECGDPIVSGKHGHIYEADGRLGVCLLDNRPSLPSKARTLLNLRRKALAAGFTPHQLGEAESHSVVRPGGQGASFASYTSRKGEGKADPDPRKTGSLSPADGTGSAAPNWELNKYAQA